MLNFIIFSKNRACQLDLLLRSIKCLGNFYYNDNISILYKSDEEHKDSYNICFSEHPKLTWLREINFQEQTQDLLKTGKYICLLTDDTVFYRRFSCMYQTLEKNEVFSWRLGYNTYIQDHTTGRQQPLLNPDELKNDQIISWNPNKYPEWCNYGYPFSFDGHVYHANLLKKILEASNFKNTNEMEGILHSKRNLVEKIYSNMHSSCVNVPCNNLSGLTLSGQQYPYSMENLKNTYCAGNRIKIPRIPIIGCHQELEFDFYRN